MTMLRFFTSDLRRNITKIICLTIGLAIGFLLVAKIYFEDTYDTFFPDADRIYYVAESVTQNEEYKEYYQTPGATAPGLKRYAPQVEAATRHTHLKYNTSVRTNDGRTFDVLGIIMADSCHFDIFATPILAGNPHEVLAVKNSVMIPRSLAEKIGGSPVGMELCDPELSEEYKVTIGGIYEDYPLNSTITTSIYLSLPTIGVFSYDGTDNWIGNDRYISFVKLAKDASPDELKPHIERMLKDNIDSETLAMVNYKVNVTHPLVGSYHNREGVKSMIWILSLLAVIMLMSAALNYLLICLGQMGKRGKEMAVRKCYGTGNGPLFGRVMGESLFFLIVSMALAVLLVLCFSDLCRELLGYTPDQLLSTGSVWLVEVLVCVALLVITGCIPAWIYCNTPVAAAFRTATQGRRNWKLALLAVQFFATGLLLCLLSLVWRQYSHLNNTEMGFEYENVARLPLYGVPMENRQALVDELRKLSDVEGVSSAYQDYFGRIFGNNVWKSDDDTYNTFNAADMYYANRDIIDVMGMRLIQGETFRENADSTVHQAIVDEQFIKMLQKYHGLNPENAIGSTFHITEHMGLDGFNEFTICGVIATIKKGGIEEETADKRGAVMFPSSKVEDNLYLKFTNLTPETLGNAQKVIDSFRLPTEPYLSPCKNSMEILTAPVKRFGTSVMVVGIAILVIAVIGLIGYTADEVQRRAKEIAIRKVSGTPATEIVKLFCKNILIVAIPSLLMGGAMAIIVGRRWLSQYSEQTSLSPLTMALCIAAIILVLIAVVTINSLSIARSNPVNHLRNE